jgi:DNA-binding response OmpR family regulator
MHTWDRKMKLLIVDDNRLLADSLKQNLLDSFVIDIAENGEQALDLAESICYDLILLDLNLPDMSGQDVCARLREKSICAPVLVITGDHSPECSIGVLNHGADDFLTKPFKTDVLRAHIKALLRRSPTIVSDTMLHAKDLVLHLDSRRLERAGRTIFLRKKEFDILAYLLRNKGKVVSRKMISTHVWEAGKEGWDATIDVHIKYLRDKIDAPFKSPLIKTVYGVGYIID